MSNYCHRCGGELAAGDGETTFCAHCGAPQLFLLDQDVPERTAEPGSTGTLPPPHPKRVEWKTAIRCAGLVALVGAVLSVIGTRVDVVSPLSELWILSGSLTTLALYQRQRPRAWMDAGVGARIGLVVGLALVVSVAASMAAAGLVARFGLHSMGRIDSDMAQQMAMMKEKVKAANPAATAELLRPLDSVEFRAGMMLAGAVMLAGFVLVFSTVGGAVGGLLRMRRRSSAR